MKYTYFILASILVLTSCKEEEIIIDPNPSDPYFSYKIDGNQFIQNNLTIEINISDHISISSITEGQSTGVTLNVNTLAFDDIIEGEIIYFSSPAMGRVDYDGSTYSNTYNGPSYDGQIVFTTKEAETLSGTFSFKAQDVDPTMFTNIWVTEGVFENISY